MANGEVAVADTSRYLRTYAEAIVRRRWLVLLLAIALTAFWVTRIGSLVLDTDPKLWAPQQHPYVQATNKLDRVFGGRNVVIVGITPRQGDIYQPLVLEKIQRLQREIEQIPHAVRHNVISLAAAKAKAIEGGADGMVVRPLMETIPQTPGEMAKLKADIASMPIYINTLVSPDGRSAAIIADFKQDQTVPNFSAMLKELHASVDKERDGTVDLHLGGTPVIGEAADVEFMKMPLYFGAALIVVMLVQLWSFRSVQGMLLPMVTGLLSVIWGIGIMGATGVHLDPLNTTTPILILAVAAGHAIQILKRYYEEYRRIRGEGVDASQANRMAVVESMVRVGPVMVTAGLIAALTFFSLATSGVAMVRHFGIFAGFGVLSTLIIEMTFVPALRSLLPAPKLREASLEQKEGVLDHFLDRMGNLLVGGSARWFLGGGLALLTLLGIGAINLRVDNNFKLYHSPTSALRVDDRILNQTFGGTNTFQFLVETPGVDGVKDPAVLQGIADLQRFLEAQPGVGKTQSIADFLERMNQAMHADDPAYSKVPPKQDLVAQYLFLYSLSGDPQDFDSFVDNDYRRAAVWTFLRDDSTAAADNLAKKAQAFAKTHFPPGVTVQMGGTLPSAVALNEIIVEDKSRNVIQMALIVFVLGAIMFRSIVAGLFVVIPLAAVTIANFGLLGWLRTPLDISAMSAAVMAIGVGADYEIYLLSRFREEYHRSGDLLGATRASLKTSGKAILFVALSVIAGYSVLQTASFAFYNQISTMVMATMAISALFALFFLRALMILFRPRFIFGDKAGASAGQVPINPIAGGAL
jgi:predicted RND superfamily exporter protein